MPVLPHRWPWRIRPVAELPEEVQRYLADTETSALGGHRHEAIMVEPIASFLGAAVFVGWALQHLPSTYWWLRDALFFGAVFLLLRALWMLLDWYQSLIFISGYRIIYVHGLISRRVEMMPLGKLTDMSYIRTPLGMVLGYGTFLLESAGQDQALSRLSPIPDPDASYRYVQNLLFKRATQWVSLKDIETEKPINIVDVGGSGRRSGSRSGGGGNGPAGGPYASPADNPRPWWKK
jgi:Bacterial PH domain